MDEDAREFQHRWVNPGEFGGMTGQHWEISGVDHVIVQVFGQIPG
jgi:hypothetical protein